MWALDSSPEVSDWAVCTLRQVPALPKGLVQVEGSSVYDQGSFLPSTPTPHHSAGLLEFGVCLKGNPQIQVMP